MNTKYVAPVLITSIIVLGAFSIKKNKKTKTEKNQGIDLVNFDTKANPREDFYQYVNGNWLKNNPIPATESAWGSFHELREKSIIQLRTILEEASTDITAPAGSNKQKIGDFYSVGMDSVKLEKDGVSPLQDEFKIIANIKTKQELINTIAHNHVICIFPLFGYYVSQDPKFSTQNISQISQGGIGLPSRDYYFDASSENIRKEYLIHLQKMFQLLGDMPEVAAKEAKTVMDIETNLAKASMTSVELRNIEAQYNKKTLKELSELTPEFNWNLYLNEIKATGVKEVIVGQPAFFEEMNRLLKIVSLEDWKTYLRWHLIHGTATKLNNAFVNENFHFYGTILAGTKELKPRWKRCLETTDICLGEALGQIYVEKHFGSESKRRVNEMVDNLTAAYKERINSRDWMSTETKKQAITKLETIVRKLGYPDKWRDYSQLEIKRDSYVMNFLRANIFDFNYMVNRLGKPVDRNEWGMTPPTVNAYYNPSLNEIVFPAGIMQPPFFNPDADDAVNYGCMGAIIGHELTHGFDDQGGQFDAQGNLKNWWTEEDKAKFKTKTQLLIKQFNNYVALDSTRINGELTIGENIADLGGLTMAFAAYKRSLQGKPVPKKLDGFTGEQRFFISWAQGWRVNTRAEALTQMIKTNPHSPGKFRVLGPLSNMPEFYQAFNVKPSDAMYRPEKERAEIW